MDSNQMIGSNQIIASVCKSLIETGKKELRKKDTQKLISDVAETVVSSVRTEFQNKENRAAIMRDILEPLMTDIFNKFMYKIYFVICLFVITPLLTILLIILFLFVDRNK